MSEKRNVFFIEDDETAMYQVMIEGACVQHVSEWLHNCSIFKNKNGKVFSAGTVIDQTMLFGLFRRIRDIGAYLLYVRHLTYNFDDCIALKRTEQYKRSEHNV